MVDRMKANHMQYALCVFIVPADMGSKIVSFVREFDILGGTIMHAKGTSSDKWMQRLQLAENHKEIVFVAAPLKKCNELMERAANHFKFERANRGICFSMPLEVIVGKHIKEKLDESIGRTSDTMQDYKAIYTIVNLGDGELVVKAASNAGAKGGTIIHGRGAGDGEGAKLFAMEIEPEKEIVLILVKDDIVDHVKAAILEAVDLTQSQTGILFVQDVISAFGLVQ